MAHKFKQGRRSGYVVCPRCDHVGDDPEEADAPCNLCGGACEVHISIATEYVEEEAYDGDTGSGPT
jgi:hypothetical protein